MEEKFEKIRVVGRGAYGVCWLCKRRGDPTGEKVIIKTISMHGLTSKEENDIKGEANLLRKMRHPMIIGYYDYFSCDTSLAIVMQYAEGGTLDTVLREQKGVHLKEPKVLDYFAQILLGLEYMHSLSIVHRDLKTQNILLNRKRTLIKLSDFGISKELTTKGVASTLIGTPNYLSPEICEGRAYNQKSDIWALGCVLYEMFMLQRAFDGESLPAIVMKITQVRYKELDNHVSAQSRQMVKLLLTQDENNRPAVKELLTCPLVLPYTLTIVLDIGRIMNAPYERKNKTPSTVRHRSASDSKTTMASSSSTSSFAYRTQTNTLGRKKFVILHVVHGALIIPQNVNVDMIEESVPPVVIIPILDQKAKPYEESADKVEMSLLEERFRQ